MPLTILGPVSAQYPLPLYPAICQVRRTWGDKWTTVPEMRLEHCTVNACGHDLDSAEVEWTYGPNVKHPFDSDFRLIRPIDASGWWLRVCLAGPQGLQPLWVGRIAGEGRNIFGAASGPAGVQRLQAYGPQQILRKQSVARSLWVPPEGSSFSRGEWWCDWMPGMNDRVGHHGLLIGNRSTDQYAPSDNAKGQSYVYGGKDLWSVYDYCQYILYWFADWSDSKGPRFTLGGQSDILKDMTFAQEWPEHTTVDKILQTLISPRYGIDFKIELDKKNKGWVVSVYSLQAKDQTWGDSTVPGNPQTVKIIAGETLQNVSTHVVRTDEQRYSRIRVMGKRIVACASFGPEAWDMLPLDPGWPAALEDDYLNAVGTPPPGAEAAGFYPAGSAQLADLIRRSHRYRDVFAVWMVPKDFDPRWLKAAIRCLPDGSISLGTDGDQPPRQTFIRHTLSWIPLSADRDYSTGWPGAAMEVAYDPEQAPQFLPPLAWLPATNLNYGILPADRVGVGVTALRQGLGVRLHTRPHHHCAGLVTWPADHPTLHLPIYDAPNMVVTMAWETDTRLGLEYEVPGGDPADGELVLYVPEAELWFLAPNTAIAQDPANIQNLKFSPNSLTIVRDDRPRLAQIMAGAIARYQSRRARAEISAAGFLPWGGLLGQILECVESGGASEQIEAPITQITWHGGSEPRTTVRTGYASAE